MESIYTKGRDSARTPMQWDDSIFYHYKKLIKLRKENETIIYGDYTPLDLETKNIFSKKFYEND